MVNKNYKAEREWVKNNRQRNRFLKMKWQKQNKEKHRLEQMKYRKKYPLKIKAHNLAQKIKIKGMCKRCLNNNASEKHHKDYLKPLEVEFLCMECHKKIHFGGETS